MVSALVIAITLTLMIGAHSLYVTYHIFIYNRYIDSVKAYELASAAVRSIYLRTNYSMDRWYMPPATAPYNVFSLAIDGDAPGTASLTYSADGLIASIESTATVGTATRIIDCKLQAVPGDDGNIHFIMWNPIKYD